MAGAQGHTLLGSLASARLSRQVQSQRPPASFPGPDEGLLRQTRSDRPGRGPGNPLSVPVSGCDRSPSSGLTCPSQRPVWAGVCLCMCGVPVPGAVAQEGALVPNPGRLTFPLEGLPRVTPAPFWGGVSPLAIPNPSFPGFPPKPSWFLPSPNCQPAVLLFLLSFHVDEIKLGDPCLCPTPSHYVPVGIFLFHLTGSVCETGCVCGCLHQCRHVGAMV